MASYDPATLKAELTRDEDRVNHLYRDTMGFETGGIGHNFSIPMSDHVIDAIYACDVAGCEASLDLHCPWWRGLDPVRQRVMMNMMFEMGWGKLGGFARTLAFVQEGAYAKAAAEMLISKWAEQVKARAHRLAIMMATGVAHDQPSVS